MHRLFVAIRPPAQIRHQLLDLMEGVPGARWQDEDQLHLTLRFIGEVGRHQAEDLALALLSVRHPCFPLALAGVGAFERNARPTSLWAGLSPRKPLEALYRKIDQGCQSVGLESEGRAYMPHVTLARLGRQAGPVWPWLAGAGALSSEEFPVDTFCLFESELHPDGSRYSVIERYPLT